MFYKDGRYVSISGTPAQFIIHQFKKANSNRDDRIKCRIDLKTSYAPTSSPVFLQAWNGINNAWETVASNNTKAADTDFSLEVLLNALDGNYYDFRESAAEVCFRVYQLNDSGVTKSISIDLVQISFLPVYQDTYVTQPSSYRPTYPHENPQDDN